MSEPLHEPGAPRTPRQVAHEGGDVVLEDEPAQQRLDARLRVVGRGQYGRGQRGAWV